MAKRKRKIVLDENAHDHKKRHGRFPTARPTEWFKDKSKYSRKRKYKDEY